jgi:predicted amidohydrolase YtcJ
MTSESPLDPSNELPSNASPEHEAQLKGSPLSPATTLYRGGLVYNGADPLATAFVIAGNRIAWIGSDAAAAGHADGVDAVVDLGGALVTPTFVDAHVHTSATGLGLRSVDLSDAMSLSQVLDRIAKASRKRGGRPVYAPNWDQQDWPEHRPPTAWELDRATYGGVVYSPRVDGHSAVISSALAAASGARNHPGWNDSGLVTREAHHAAREAFHAGISSVDRRADIDAAMSAATAAGIGLLHENGGPSVSSEADFADVLAAQRQGDGPEVIGYWGELVGDQESARALTTRLGARGLAGDLNIDGSIGSRTASLRERYVDVVIGAGRHRAGGQHRADGSGSTAAGLGNAYLSVEQVRDHVAACSLAGIQAGFHVIGDAGSDTAIAGFQAAADQIGVDRVIAGRHRLEHLELIDIHGIRALAELGVSASVQPAFHTRWGGPEGMYAARLGAERTGRMNLFGTMAEAGMPLALGSDSPVTPFAPWEAIRGCVNHHNPAQRISKETAFLAHTRGGWRAAGVDNRGYLEVDQPASFAVWSAGAVGTVADAREGSGVSAPDRLPDRLPDLSAGAALPTNLRTVIQGRTVFDRGGFS